LRAEPAMLHGAIVWLVAIPLLVAYATFGSTSFAGAWYGGLAGSPAWVASGGTAVDAVTSQGPSGRAVTTDREREDAARAARNSALSAASALLLGLVGSVVGGWMGSGEPMTLSLRRAAKQLH